jgi:hypothetical protein
MVIAHRLYPSCMAVMVLTVFSINITVLWSITYPEDGSNSFPPKHCYLSKNYTLIIAGGMNLNIIRIK